MYLSFNFDYPYIMDFDFIFIKVITTSKYYKFVGCIVFYKKCNYIKVEVITLGREQKDTQNKIPFSIWDTRTDEKQRKVLESPELIKAFNMDSDKIEKKDL